MEKERQKKVKLFFEALPYLLLGILYLIILCWITFKMNRGFGPMNDRTEYIDTGERDYAGRETYVKGRSGDFGSHFNLLWVIINPLFIMYLGFNLEINDDIRFIFIPLSVASCVIIIISARIGRQN
jgi:hypothetical protein